MTDDGSYSIEAIAKQGARNEQDINTLIVAGRQQDQDLGALNGRVNALASAQQQLAGAVRTLAQQQGTQNPIPPFCYLTATDAQLIKDKLDELETWLNRVLCHYPDGIIPDSWRRYPHVVEELFVLMDGWLEAYSPGAKWTSREDWHGRFLIPTLKRVRAGCKAELMDHPCSTQDFVPPAQLGLDSNEDIANWWARTHGAEQEPPLSPDAYREADRRSRTDL